MALILVCGKDYPSVLHEARQQFQKLSANSDEMNHEIIDAASSTIDSASNTISSCIQAILTRPMFGGAKVIWFKNATFFADQTILKNPKVQKSLENLLATLKEMEKSEVSLIISCSEINRASSFFKAIDKFPNSQIVTKNIIDPSSKNWEQETRQYAQSEARRLGLTFTSKALEIFIQRISETPSAIAQELEKIDLFLGENQREIDEATVCALVAQNKTSSIFEIGNAIESGNFAKAIALIEFQLSRKESGIAILNASILPTIRRMYQCRLMADIAGTTSRDWETRIPHDYSSLILTKKDGSSMTWQINRTMPIIAKISTLNLFQALKACYQAQKTLVTTQAQEIVTIQKLIASIKLSLFPK